MKYTHTHCTLQTTHPNTSHWVRFHTLCNFDINLENFYLRSLGPDQQHDHSSISSMMTWALWADTVTGPMTPIIELSLGINGQDDYKAIIWQCVMCGNHTLHISHIYKEMFKYYISSLYLIHTPFSLHKGYQWGTRQTSSL